ncbi:MAG: alpha-amylase family glycosyl hydrolase [Hydrogenophilus thermoluteolus]
MTVTATSSHPTRSAPPAAQIPRWWHDAVIYTVWVRSFADGNGDGIGDLQGLITRLDALAWLGVDTLWLTPIHPSPNADFGYDVTDYCAIHPDFGTLADFDTLVAELHRRGMRLVLDLVINHTSCDHPWFRAAERGEAPYREWYYWRDAPNDWEAIFGGSAWSWSETAQQYYLHLFLPQQPDLNWENSEVRAALAEIARFWLDRGVDGFRFDALTVLKKAPGLPSVAPTGGEPRCLAAPEAEASAGAAAPPSENRHPLPQPAWSHFLAQPGLEALFADFVRRAGLTRDHLTLGEANGLPVERAAQWIAEPNGLLSFLLHFELWHIDRPTAQGGTTLDTVAFSESCVRWWQTARALGTRPALYLENHDLPRVVSRWADDRDPDATRRAAKAFAAAQLLQPAVPILYQGQELGLPNARLTHWAQIHDRAAEPTIAALRAKGETDSTILAALSRTGRDAVRTPYPWDATQPFGGFSPAPPWTPLPPEHLPLAWQQQYEDPHSTLHWYRHLIHRRRQRNQGVTP